MRLHMWLSPAAVLLIGQNGDYLSCCWWWRWWWWHWWQCFCCLYDAVDHVTHSTSNPVLQTILVASQSLNTAHRDVIFTQLANNAQLFHTADDQTWVDYTMSQKKLCIFRSTSKSRPNNIRGKNVLTSVRTSVRPQKVSSIWMKFGI